MSLFYLFRSSQKAYAVSWCRFKSYAIISQWSKQDVMKCPILEKNQEFDFINYLQPSIMKLVILDLSML